jgi:hypothetical protein
VLVKEQANGSVVMDKGPGIDLDLCGPLAFDTGVKAKLSTKGVEKPDIHMQKIQTNFDTDHILFTKTNSKYI